MKRTIFCIAITVVMSFSSFTTAFAQQAPAAITNVNPHDLEKIGDKTKKLLDGIDQLNGIDLNKSQPSKESTQNSNEDTNSIETNMMIAAGDGFTLGLKSNGTVIATGLSLSGADQVSDWTNITMISCGLNHSVGLKADGTVVAVGSNAAGECDVSSWKDIKMIAAGLDFTVGLKKDGTVVSTGANEHGQIDVQTWKNIEAISAGAYFIVALREDGTALAIGKNCSGILNVSGWHDLASVSASYDNIVGLEKNGTVLNTMKTDTSLFKNTKAIAASAGYVAGLNKDGTVITNNDTIDTSTWKDIIAISAASDHLVGLKSDGTVLAVSANGSFGLGTNVSGWMLKVPAVNKKTNIAGQYTVTLNSNGGSAVNSLTVAQNAKIKAPKSPIMKGYKFLGWYTTASDGKKIVFPYIVRANVTLYAHWGK
jgi:Listeria/Bacterioides repeat